WFRRRADLANRARARHSLDARGPLDRRCVVRASSPARRETRRRLKVLEEIEAEMRALGMWDAKEGTFENELRRNLEKPGLYDRAHAEWVKWGPEDDAPKKLLGLLRRLDRLLEFNPKV